MVRPLITSLSNPLVKQARTLRGHKARAESGLFLVEGIHHVGEAVEAGWEIASILYAPDLLVSDFARNLVSRFDSTAQPVSVSVMESLADKENPQGILAVVHQKRKRLEEIESIRCGAAVVSPQDPGNVGTILRTLDAVGADALFLLDGGVDPYHPTSIRASMGAIFWKSLIQCSFDEFVNWTRREKIQRVGTSAYAKDDYRAFTPAQKFVLVLGSEQKGLSPDQLKACDAAISLPMRGRASSLNLAVAAGVLLYQLVQPQPAK
jgi:TrmH family RNA methyltransferase